MNKNELEALKKKLAAAGKDPKFIEMLLKNTVKPKRMF